MRRVRVLPVVGLAYAFLRREAISIVKAFWLPFLFATPFAYLVTADQLTASDRDLIFPAAPSNDTPLLVGGLLTTLLIATSVAGVTASRKVLFGRELRASLGDRRAWFQFAAMSAVFIAVSFGLSLAVSKGLMAIALPLAAWIPLTEDQGYILGYLIGLSGVPVFALLFARVALVYPVTIASGRSDWRVAWSLARRNTWRILMILLLCLAPASIVGQGVHLGLEIAFSDLVVGTILHTIVQYAFWVASSALAFPALCYAYKALMGQTAEHLFVPP